MVALVCPGAAAASEALVLGRDVYIRDAPKVSARVIQRAHPGETYEIIGGRGGRGQLFYIFDERGDLWVKIQVTRDVAGYVRTDLVSVAREEFRSPRGTPLLIVNLRPTPDGTVLRDLWLVQDDWRRTRRLAAIEGRPIWASHGQWFLSQVDSERPIKDQAVDRTVEWIERFSADGRSSTLLAAGSYPVLDEARGEVYFYRDVDEQGEAVPPGLFAVSLDRGSLRPVFLLPERYRFWREDGDYFVQAPPPLLNGAAQRVSIFAFDRAGTRTRFQLTLDGQLVHARPE